MDNKILFHAQVRLGFVHVAGLPPAPFPPPPRFIDKRGKFSAEKLEVRTKLRTGVPISVVFVLDPWNTAAGDEKAREYLETFVGLFILAGEPLPIIERLKVVHFQ